MKKVLALTLALALVLTAPIATASAKTIKPGQIKNFKAVADVNMVTLSWTKVKNAKTYKLATLKNAWSSWKKTSKVKYLQYKKAPKKYKVRVVRGVCFFKSYGKRYVVVKTIKANKVAVKNLKAKTTYKFRVRAVNGKKYGKYSKILTTKTKAKPIKEIIIEPVIGGDINTVIAKARELIGVSHAEVGRCGGFIQKCYAAAGVEIKNPAGVNNVIGNVVMEAASKTGPMLTWDDFKNKIKPGDILVKGEGGTWNIAPVGHQSHVQLYIGNKEVMHSTSGGNGGVKTGTVAGKYYRIIRVMEN